MLEYNYKNNIRINIDHASLSPQREFDKSIMEIASQLYDNSLSLTSINIVPMAHGFHDLSSICTASGKALFKPYLCSSTINIPCNNDIWPVKHHVRPKDYTIWRKFLKKVFPANSLSLPFSLGKWFHSPVTKPKWDWFLSPCFTFLYHFFNNLWHCHVKCVNPHKSYYQEYLILNNSPSASIH